MSAYRMGKDLYNPTSNRRRISKIHKELKKVDIKIPNNSVKNWGRSKKRILSKRISNGQETLKGMFNALSHQGNEN